MARKTKLVLKKKYVKLAVVAFFLLCIIIGGTYAFYTKVVSSNNQSKLVAGIFKIDYEDKNEINLENTYPMSDDEGMKTKPYTFTIKNEGSVKGKYAISIKDDNKNTLDPSNIRYSIKEGDGEWSSPAVLQKDALLVSNKLLNDDSEITYQLKIWLKENAPNEVQGLIYKSKIVVDVVQMNANVVTTEYPVIVLNGNKIASVSQNSSYTDPGVERIDSSENLNVNNIVKSYEYYNGVTTTEVNGIDTSQLGSYYIYYRITDSKGNTGTTSRVVNVYNTDNATPSIELSGSSIVTIEEGSNYVEPGYSGTDSNNNNLTNKVIVTGDINSDVPGVYTLKYILELSNGNITSATREVIVSSRTIKAYIYNQTTGSASYCVTGNEATCQETNCYNSTTANSCAAGTIIKYKVNDSQTVTFHVMYDDANTITLQSQQNIVYNTAWISDTDYGTTAQNDKGPLTVLSALENATSSWTNVNDQTYTMGTTTFKTNAYTGCSATSCTENKYALASRTAKARMITVQETALLGCTGTEHSCPIWMNNYLESYDNYNGTETDNPNEHNYGYWTMSTGSAYTLSSWYVYRNGQMGYFGVSDTNRGARAVIVIPKGYKTYKKAMLAADETNVDLDLTNNQTEQINLTTKNAGNISYESSDPTVATVSSTGLITAVGMGQAIITITESNTGAKTTVIVSVSRTLSVNFTKGDNVASIGSTTATCTIDSTNSTCNITLPTITADTGYSSDGWYLGNTKVGDAGGSYTLSETTHPTGTSSITLVAKGIMSAHTVTADANGGSIPSTTGWTGTGATATKSVASGSAYGELPTPTRTGYTFKGWNGKNLLNYNNVTTTAETYGIQVDANGNISDSTSDSDGRIWDYSNSNWYMSLNSGTYTVTLYFQTETTNSTNSGCVVYDSNNTVLVQNWNLSNTETITGSFTLSSETEIGVMIKGYDGVYKIQLEQNNTSTQWEPYYITSSTNVTATSDHTIKAIWADETKPTCSWSDLTPLAVKGTGTATLTCTDNGSGVVSKTLETTDFTTTANGQVTAVSAPSQVTNGYSYTVTLTGVTKGTFTASLNAGSISDNDGNTNDTATSDDIAVGTLKTATFKPNSNGVDSLSTPSGCSKDSSTGNVTCKCAVTSGSSCSVPTPSITAPEATPNICGFKTSSTGSNTGCTAPNSSVTISSNKTYYAQTYSEKTLSVTFSRNTTEITNSLSSTNVGCTVIAYNGNAPVDGCMTTTTSPTFTAADGYSEVGFFTTDTGTITESSNPVLVSGTTFIITEGSTDLTYGRIQNGATVYARGRYPNASEVGYDNSETSLSYSEGTSCTNTQCALDALDRYIDDLPEPDKNFMAAYTYNETSGESNYCVTGYEQTCQTTTCYKTKSANSCPAGTIIKYRVNNTTTETFHVMYDDANTITMQSQRNTVYNTAWITEEEYVAAGKGSAARYATNGKKAGPLTILPVLENATASWTNVNNQTYTMGTTVFKTNQYTACSTGDYICNGNEYTLGLRKAKSRMITLQEATYLGCTETDQSCPVWMHNYLYGATLQGGTADDSPNTTYNSGYWTMSANTSINSYTVFNVFTSGRLETNKYSATKYGARAVVVVNK